MKKPTLISLTDFSFCLERYINQRCLVGKEVTETRRKRKESEMALRLLTFAVSLNARSEK